MITLFDSYKNTMQFTDYFNVVNKKTSPFKEMIKKEDFSSYSFSLDEGEEISLKDAFLLLVNIKDSGSIYVVYPKDEFNKEEITKRLAELKEIKIDYNTVALTKSKSAFEILDEYHPYMYLYVQKNDYYLTIDELKEIYQGSSPIFIIEKEKEEAPTSYKEERNDNKNKEKKKISLKEFILPIKQNKYHFLFLSISSFLVGFASSIGIFNSILNKGIAVLFYICAFIGAFLQTFIYYDYFKEKGIKDINFRYSLFFSILGSLLSMGAYSIYHTIDKSEGKENVSIVLLMLLALFISIGLVALSVGIGYLITKKNKK